MTQRNMGTGRVRRLALDVAPGARGGPAGLPELVEGVLARCRDVTVTAAATAGAGGADGDEGEEVCISTWRDVVVCFVYVCVCMYQRIARMMDVTPAPHMTLPLQPTPPTTHSLPRLLRRRPRRGERRAGAAGLHRAPFPPPVPEGLAAALALLPGVLAELRPAHRCVRACVGFGGWLEVQDRWRFCSISVSSPHSAQRNRQHAPGLHDRGALHPQQREPAGVRGTRDDCYLLQVNSLPRFAVTPHPPYNTPSPQPSSPPQHLSQHHPTASAPACRAWSTPTRACATPGRTARPTCPTRRKARG